MGQFERVNYINKMINSKDKVTLKEVVTNFEVSKRTVIRDIEYMKNTFNAPIVYSREKGGYIYKHEFDAFNFTDEKMILFYTFLKSITKKELNYIPFVSQNMISKMSRDITTKYRQLSENIDYELSIYENISIKMLHDILQCIIERLQCSITYVNAAGERSRRYIEPLKLVNYYGIWYLIAYCCRSEAIRTFVISRIISIGVTKNPYTNRVEKDNLEEFLSRGFGIVKGGEPRRVTIRFYDKAYYIVRSQIWHHDQQKEEGQDEKHGPYVELSFPVSSYSEILGRVLQYNVNAEVIAPEDFRQTWLDTIDEMCKRYNDR